MFSVLFSLHYQRFINIYSHVQQVYVQCSTHVTVSIKLEVLYCCYNVHELTITSLGPLVGKVKEHHVETIVDSLCSNMLSDNEQLRDISSIGKQFTTSTLCVCMHELCICTENMHLLQVNTCGARKVAIFGK